MIMSKVILTKDMGAFAAAHSLPEHEGGCFNLHGHNYRVRISVEGAVIKDSFPPGRSDIGMIIDFKVLKTLYKEHVHAKLDHAFILGFNEPLWYQEYYELLGDSRAAVDNRIGKVAHLDILETTAEYLANWILQTMDTVLNIWLVEHPDVRSGTDIPAIHSVEVYETETSIATAYAQRPIYG